jgi:hypothetical protein
MPYRGNPCSVHPLTAATGACGGCGAALCDECTWFERTVVRCARCAAAARRGRRRWARVETALLLVLASVFLMVVIAVAALGEARPACYVRVKGICLDRPRPIRMPPCIVAPGRWNPSACPECA